MPFNQGGMQGGMQGGLFGPMGGSQNFGGGQMTDQELQMLLGQMQSQSPSGPTLPMYNPAPAGGPPSPQGVPGLGTTGIDPSMMASGSGGGLEGMDFGTQAGDQMGGMQDAIMSMGRQKAEEERIRKLLAASMGSGGNVPVRPATAGWLANPGSGHGMGGPSGMNTRINQTGAPMGYAPR